MPTLSFADFSARVLALYLPPMRSRATYLGMRRALLDFAAAVQPQTLEDFDTGHVAAFVASRAGQNDNTTRSKLRYLRTAANHAIAEGWLDRGPRWGRLFPRRVPGRRRDLDFDQVSLLLRYLERLSRRSWVDHRLYALVALVAYTGLRRSEALHLKPIDVRLSEGFLVVSGRRRLKTEASAAPVPIPPGLAPILAGWLPRCGAEWVFPGRMGRGPWVHAAAGYRPLDQLQKAGAAMSAGRVRCTDARPDRGARGRGLDMAGSPPGRVYRRASARGSRCSAAPADAGRRRRRGASSCVVAGRT